MDIVEIMTTDRFLILILLIKVVIYLNFENTFRNAKCMSTIITEFLDVNCIKNMFIDFPGRKI